MATTAHVCVFDLHETLLDLRGLDHLLAWSFADAGSVRRRWWAQIIQSTCVGIITDHYVDFAHLAEGALEMVAATEDVTLSPKERQDLLEQWRALPAHADVRGALERLREAGLRLAVLTNATGALAAAQLAHARLADLFEVVLSAEAVRRHKPAPEPYRMAAERLGVPTGYVRLISAHAWDIAGARHAGCAAALVARPGLPFDPLVLRPEVVGEGLTDVVEQIIAAEEASDKSGSSR
jgi:2-haloacid dehalogenase